MHRFKYIIPLMAGLALAGCDMAPRYARPALPVPPSLPTGPAYRPADQGGATEMAPADIAWRDFFTDPNLREVIALALANNRDLRIAVANVAQARALYRVQRADLLPTIAADANATWQKSSASTLSTAAVAAGGRRSDVFSADIGLSSWEIDLFGRVRNLTKEAAENALASGDARAAAQVSLIAEVAGAWLTLASDQDGLRIAEDTVQAFGQTLELTRARFKSGISSELDVRQAQTSYDDARVQVARRTTLVAQDRNALDLLAGARVPDALLPAGLPAAGATIAALPAGLASDVLLRRPDIAEAEHRLRAANADIGAARAAFFPNISLTAALGSMSLGLSNLFAQGNGTWSVAPAASQTIFDFGRNKGNLRYSEATRDAALAQYEKAVQTGFREVADALATRGTIDRQIEAEASLRDAAAAGYKLSEARFRTGIDPFLTTLDSQRTLFTAEQGLIATRLAAQNNLVELYRSLGGGLK
ncbi:outer membrane protein, multidrug efflux system [Sphingomonas sp. YR710]|uniref:efflux transporter outer membrane subunit n=1 Tax=Sphingomonas sp. YR710 TaxID=1882773 RepID=UPI00088BD927|nr:efflux transporter outer membrane subunit [Sphingomonas sp. YR710]SDC70881.1 outer membrane protein, multidrug efflux system [Sphingomonas sp. YR710]